MQSLQTGQLVDVAHRNKTSQQQYTINNRKLINDSNYNINKNHNLNNVHVNNNSIQNNKNKENDSKKCDNNIKKFAFLAQSTIPDYRPQVTRRFAYIYSSQLIHSNLHLGGGKKPKDNDQSKYKIPSIASDIWSSGREYQGHSKHEFDQLQKYFAEWFLGKYKFNLCRKRGESFSQQLSTI